MIYHPPSVSPSVDDVKLTESSESSEISQSEFEQVTLKKPLFINQKDLNDFARDLDVTKMKSEILTARLQQRNLLASKVSIVKGFNIW